MTIPTASLRSRLFIVSVAVVALALLAWATRRFYVTVAAIAGDQRHGRLVMIFTVAFVLLAWNMTLSYLERPFRLKNVAQQQELSSLYVTVPVPAYNEDPDALAECVRSLLNQTRRPDHVFVVDDGSTVSYGDVEDVLRREAEAVGVKFTWRRVANAGKRHAQALVFAEDRRADVFVTVDSDSFLERRAMREVLTPLVVDKRVGSVAGIVVAYNNRRNLLARVTDLIFVSGQLSDRSALSAMGSVLVNSGPLAAYRAPVVRRHLTTYLTETFAGRHVEFSDDSMLTLFGLAEGYRAVQQPTAVVYTLMPERLSHHLRQFLRWMRGSTIRSVWRFKYLPLGSYAYWGHALRWTQVALSVLIAGALLISGALFRGDVLVTLIMITVAIGYMNALRYLQLRRSDESFLTQLGTFALAPLATFWSFAVLRPVRWYGMATCMKTGWGTRTKGVEVAVTQ